MRRFTSLALLAICLPLAGCGTTYSVVAVTAGNDRYFGTAHSFALGESTFQLQNAKGVVCKGKYTTKMTWSKAQGATVNGKMTCSDGRSGSWVATGDAYGGQGAGLMDDGEKVDVYFGNMASRQQIR